MKKILLSILCFCLIISVFTFNCFAGTAFESSFYDGIDYGFGPSSISCQGYYDFGDPNDAVLYNFAFDGRYDGDQFNEIYLETQSGEFWSSMQQHPSGDQFITQIFSSNYEGNSLTFTPTFYFNQPFVLDSNTDGVYWYFSADNYVMENTDYDYLVGYMRFSYSYYDINGNLVNDSSPLITLGSNYSDMSSLEAPIPNIIKANIPAYNSYSYVVINSLQLELVPNVFTNFNGFDYCSFWYISDAGASSLDIMPDNLTIVQEVVNPNIIQWLVTSLNSFFDVAIFGDITIGNIFGIALAVPLVIWFLKLFAGG